MPENITALPVRLGVNIDHIATIRNARGGMHPQPLRAAEICLAAGADGITMHLREDRRHIRDEDVYLVKKNIALPLNFEMAATEEMLAIAEDVLPHSCCIVPEKRQELTTEGGLDVVNNIEYLKKYNASLKKNNIIISLFIDADEMQVRAAHDSGADMIEIHTGTFCHAKSEQQQTEFNKIAKAANLAASLGLKVAAGHGLDYVTAKKIATILEIEELNIGHFIIGEAALYGLTETIHKMKEAIKR